MTSLSTFSVGAEEVCGGHGIGLGGGGGGSARAARLLFVRCGRGWS